MARKPCAEQGCSKLTDSSRCIDHARARDRRRGTTSERGYGSTHQAERERWSPIVATGHVKCARCREPISPSSPWDLGHRDDDRSKYAGPEHAACNRATAGRRNNISPDA